ncbi:MAG: dienelactone hydrolase family protein [Gammaproteobacteria bacterium]
MYQHNVVLLLAIVLFVHSTYASSLGNHNKKFTPAFKVSQADWSNIDELNRTWDAAIVRIPKTGGAYSSFIMSDLDKQDTITLQSFPTIIYLHGCSGVWSGTYTRLNFLAQSGFVVIAPVSFARSKYPQSCDPASAQGGMYRGTLIMRQNDAAYAIANAKQLSWVDENNVFLMGHSQGGVTTATFNSKDENMSVTARIIEGWTCHAGWPEYKGINAPANEPVLALVAENDPWFQNSWTRGNCGAYINKHNGSQSIVLSEGVLSARHALLEDKDLQEAVLEFLREHMH